MVLTQRERHIAIVAAAMVAGGILLWAVFHYTSSNHDIAEAVQKAGDEKKRLVAVYDERDRLAKQYKDMVAHGLKNNQAEAKTQVRDLLEEWAPAASIREKTLNDGQISHEGEFDKITFKLSGWGPESTVAKLLNFCEYATVPLRVDKLTMKPPKEGMDYVYFELTLSTICEAPKDNKNNRTRAGLDSIPLRGDRL